ncbi:MAG TPA: thiol peroxidase [Elusimicrobiota bacterium]|nr:thiol peroxidase [Elusimicrobiota bacterium]HMX93996.1 thiol peroxidase [Elusimicrobiota bacterium]HNA60319.1 thiol peroxidase [Elusimicrobiota bacterium]HND63671.1 thiol peroxidase [Elusimicrobiota bacterium]
MSNERKGGTTFKGNPLTLVGNEIKVGQKAPEFKAVAGDLSEVNLAKSAGKTRLIVAVPSLDTPVCDAETRKFNEAVSKVSGVQTYVISMDLPFAQGRFCQTAGIKNLQPLSDHRDASFGVAYGTLIKELRLLSRAVFVVNAQDVVTYVEYVPEMTNHPNYDAALAALRQPAGV